MKFLKARPSSDLGVSHRNVLQLEHSQVQPECFEVHQGHHSLAPQAPVDDRELSLGDSLAEDQVRRVRDAKNEIDLYRRQTLPCRPLYSWR